MSNKYTYKFKEGNYYQCMVDGKVQQVNPLDVRYNGTSLGLQIELYKTLDRKYQDLQSKVDNAIFAIRAILLENGIDNPSDDLKLLTSEIRHLKTIVNGKEYLNFTLDNDGYIKGFTPFNSGTNNLVDVTSIGDIPYDVDNGCYYIDDVYNVIVKDKDKEKEMWDIL